MKTKLIINNFNELKLEEQKEIQDFVSGITLSWKIEEIEEKSKSDKIHELVNQIISQQEEIKQINEKFHEGYLYLGDKDAYDRDIKHALNDLREMKKELLRLQDDKVMKNCRYCGLPLNTHDGSGFCPSGIEEYGGKR